MSVRDTLRRVQLDLWVNFWAGSLPSPIIGIGERTILSSCLNVPELNGNGLLQEERKVFTSLYPKSELGWVLLRAGDRFEEAIATGRFEIEGLKLQPLFAYPSRNLVYGPPTHRRWPRSRSHHYQPSRK